ncbi:MAG: hypothetical protein OXN89_01965 [Bryobacterales bacterium]|nr:hypothetical protein [Bryobacterales bacterium]
MRGRRPSDRRLDHRAIPVCTGQAGSCRWIIATIYPRVCVGDLDLRALAYGLTVMETVQRQVERVPRSVH